MISSLSWRRWYGVTVPGGVASSNTAALPPVSPLHFEGRQPARFHVPSRPLTGQHDEALRLHMMSSAFFSPVQMGGAGVGITIGYEDLTDKEIRRNL
jgi:hypothetical protein